MSTELTVLDPELAGLSTETLVDKANETHGQALTFRSHAIAHAIRCGEILIELRGRITTGEWSQWADDHLRVSMYQRGVYMRIARHQDLIRRHEITSIKDGARLLAHTGSTIQPPRSDPTLMPEAQRLRAEGMTYKDIGIELGMSASGARNLIMRNQDRARDQRRNQERRRALEAVRTMERRKFAQKKGSRNLAATYEHIRKALAALQSAHDEEQDADARQAITKAMHRAYDVEDAIIKAIGTSRRKATA